MFKINVKIVKNIYDVIDEFEYHSTLVPIVGDCILNSYDKYEVIERVIPHDNPHFILIKATKK